MQTIKYKFHKKKPLPNWDCKTMILETFNIEVGSNSEYYYVLLRKKGGWSNRFWLAVNDYEDEKQIN